jgi:hypothetical protein
MTIADLRQALFEQLHEIETKYAVQYSRGATLYIADTAQIIAAELTSEDVDDGSQVGPLL